MAQERSSEDFSTRLLNRLQRGMLGAEQHLCSSVQTLIDEGKDPINILHRLMISHGFQKVVLRAALQERYQLTRGLLIFLEFGVHTQDLPLYSSGSIVGDMECIQEAVFCDARSNVSKQGLLDDETSTLVSQSTVQPKYVCVAPTFITTICLSSPVCCHCLFGLMFLPSVCMWWQHDVALAEMPVLDVDGNAYCT